MKSGIRWGGGAHVRLLLPLLLLAGGLIVLPPGARGATLAAESTFVATLKDQFGQIRPGAWVSVRERVSYAVVASATTNQWGNAVLQLDPTKRYIVTVHYREFGSNELWWYGYIDPPNWPQAVWQRNIPWIDNITLPPQPFVVGSPYTIQAIIGYPYRVTNFDLRVRMTLWVDDDGQAPYLYEETSATQTFQDGVDPVQFSYTPTWPGHYLVRFRLETNWEGNGWDISDEGGWQWAFDVTDPTATPTVTPTPTTTPQPDHCVLTGTVYEDTNRNGMRSAGEPPVSGVEVVLYGVGNVVLARQVTGSDGGYRFERSQCDDGTLSLGGIPPIYQKTDLTYPGVCGAGQTCSGLDFPLLTWRCLLPLVER